MTQRVTFTNYYNSVSQFANPKSLGDILWFWWILIPSYFRYLDRVAKHETD